MKQACKTVLCETCKARVYFPVQNGLLGQNWIKVILVCFCLGLICYKGHFLILCLIVVGYLCESTTRRKIISLSQKLVLISQNIMSMRQGIIDDPD